MALPEVVKWLKELHFEKVIIEVARLSKGRIGSEEG